MRKTETAANQQPKLAGKRNTVAVPYTAKDAQQRLHAFLREQGPDINVHEVAVDYYAENPDFSEGFQAFCVIHVLEDILKHMISHPRLEPTQQLELPLQVMEYGGLPDYIPYVSDTGQPRWIAASEAEWFHLNAWRNAVNRAFRTRARRHRNINRIVTFFEPYMKGTGSKVRHVCATLKSRQVN